MGLLNNIVKGAYKYVLDPFTTTLAHPIQVAKAVVSPSTTVSDVIKKTTSESKGQQIVEVLTTATAIAGIGGAVKAVATKGLAAAASALIPSTTKGKVIAAVATPVAVGVLTETKKPLTTLAQAPGNLANVGSNVGKLINDPSLANAEKLLKENPGTVIALGAGAAALGAGALISGIGAVENIQTRESVKELTRELKTDLSTTPNIPQTATLPKDKISLVDNTPMPSNPNVPMTPVTPQTGTLTQTNTRKVSKYKKKKPTLPTSINQKVNVIVQNRNSTVGIRQSKNYLNKRLLA